MNHQKPLLALLRASTQAQRNINTASDKLSRPDRPAQASRARRGTSLVEILTVAFVLMLVTGATLTLTTSATGTFDQRTKENTLGNAARRSLEEMLYELRASSQIHAALSIGGLSMTSTTGVANDGMILLEAPGYNASGILSGTYDLVGFRYDRATRTLRETTLVRGGSQRPARLDYVIARQVERVEYTYRVREQFTYKAGQSLSFAMKATPRATPTVYVNGVKTAGVTGTTTCTLPATPTLGAGGKADVQFVYAVDPAANPGGMAHVSGVDVTLILSESGSSSPTRTVTLSGNARLRNQRT